MPHILEALRAANIARNKEWENKSKPFATVFWVNELAGEGGEACNILKKLDREFIYNTKGSRAKPAALLEELADVVICTDLLGMNLAITFPANNWPKFPTTRAPDFSRYGASLMAGIGRACALVINEHSKTFLPPVLSGVIIQTKTIADYLGLDLEKGVATKFNMTSAKLGLKTRLK